MKIWYEHGSEHSANLVMIGKFETADKAMRTMEIINALRKQVETEQDKGALVLGNPSERYGNAILDLMGALNVASIAPQELEQFLYDVFMEVKGSQIILTTEEIDISAFLKVMFDHGARIEVYSAHHHPNSPGNRDAGA